MKTIDCLTTCICCKNSFVKSYKVTDIYLQDKFKKYDNSVCENCNSTNELMTPIKSALDVVDHGINSTKQTLVGIANIFTK
jgi:hypothetical protein